MKLCLSDDDKKEIVLMYHKQKMPVTEITARKYISYGTVYRVLRKESTRHGYMFGKERLRFLIRESYANGMKPKEISDRNGISIHTVYRYLYSKEHGSKPDVVSN